MTFIKKTPQSFFKIINEFIEAIIVLSLGFGLFIFSSTKTAFFTNSIISKTQTYNIFDFIFIAIYELIILGIIIYFLKYKRWTLKDFNLDFAPIMLGIGFVLALIRISSGICLNKTIEYLYKLYPNNISDTHISLNSNPFGIVLIVIINSFFEEFLLIGYLFKRFEKHHTAILIITSSIIRASFHTYQGWHNMPSIFIMALIFGLYYAREKKLWTIIIAHAIGNIFYFLNENYSWLNV